MLERLNDRFYYSCTVEMFGLYIYYILTKEKKKKQTKPKPKQGRLLETYLQLKSAGLDML